MKLTKTACHIAILGALLTSSSLVVAQSMSAAEWRESYGYLGLAGGESRFQFDEQRMVTTQLPTGVIGSGITDDDKRDRAWRVFGGIQYNRYWALELGYFDLGRSRFTSSIYPTGDLRGEVKVKGASLDLVGSAPLNERFALVGRVGAHFSRTRAAFGGTGNAAFVSSTPSDRKTNMKVGAGMQYAFTPQMIVRLEGERYKLDDPLGGKGYANAALISVVIPINRQSSRAMTASASVYTPEPAAAVVVVDPSPPAQVVIAPPPTTPPVRPMRSRVTLSSESLFGFDKATIRPETLGVLDALARDARDANYESISIEGHTDRLGSTTYNQSLSERRADAVKGYLVDTGKLDGARIRTVGKNESMPVTKSGECVGTASTKKLVACLQPDRRVDVEVVGTR